VRSHLAVMMAAGLSSCDVCRDNRLCKATCEGRRACVCALRRSRAQHTYMSMAAIQPAHRLRIKAQSHEPGLP
jgi:hypothetical protein